jgi:Uma2 family endonuclease
MVIAIQASAQASANDSPLSPLTLKPQRCDANWQDYTVLRDRQDLDWPKITFYQGWLRIEMGAEGPGHARFSDLITILFGFWAFCHPEEPIESFGRCLIEKPETHACAPDLLLYKGADIPQWQVGEPRRLNLANQRVPDLVGEISDTTLHLDLDEQKQLYASLGIAEYWVIDVKAGRLFAFGLNRQTGAYEKIEVSGVLAGLSIDLVEQTLERLTSETNTAAANWFMEQLRAN